MPIIGELSKFITRPICFPNNEYWYELITPRKGGSYTFVRNNFHDLIITNAFDSSITKDDFCTIILSKFYKIPKMKTLSIKFADKEIVLKDHEKEISAARDISVVEKEYKDQVYNDVFTEVMMLSDQPHRHRRHIRNRRSDTNIRYWENKWDAL